MTSKSADLVVVTKIPAQCCPHLGTLVAQYHHGREFPTASGRHGAEPDDGTNAAAGPASKPESTFNVHLYDDPAANTCDS